jgi:hypothetical protein
MSLVIAGGTGVIAVVTALAVSRTERAQLAEKLKDLKTEVDQIRAVQLRGTRVRASDLVSGEYERPEFNRRGKR